MIQWISSGRRLNPSIPITSYLYCYAVSLLIFSEPVILTIWNQYGEREANLIIIKTSRCLRCYRWNWVKKNTCISTIWQIHSYVFLFLLAIFSYFNYGDFLYLDSSWQITLYVIWIYDDVFLLDFADCTQHLMIVFLHQ